jgi:hypothetical protein
MSEERKYSYNRFDSKGERVGQAVMDILKKDNPVFTVEEVMDQMQYGVMNYIQDAVTQGYKHFKENFYIIHRFRKELTYFDIHNVPAQHAVCFQLGPKESSWYMEVIPHDTKTLYEVDVKNDDIKLLWSVPGWEDCKSIKKNPHLYDRDLVSWVKEATAKFEIKAT